MTIAIQGIRGSFHHEVATSYFGNTIDLIECMSFKEVPTTFRERMADAAVIAIENSTTGAILSNYALIDQFDLNISGEFYLPMVHNFMALKGQRAEDIEEVWSHPIAIQHCKRFFRHHPRLRIIEEKDTASVAKEISEKKLKNVAALASIKAAEIYDLHILQESVQDDELNMTRFFILTNKRHFGDQDHLNNKASLKFVTHNETGNLADILAECAKHKLNLSKIQSLPLSNDPWNYGFFIDFTFDDYHEYCKALLKLETMVSQLKILGEYKEWRTISNKKLV